MVVGQVHGPWCRKPNQTKVTVNIRNNHIFVKKSLRGRFPLFCRDCGNRGQTEDPLSQRITGLINLSATLILDLGRSSLWSVRSIWKYSWPHSVSLWSLQRSLKRARICPGLQRTVLIMLKTCTIFVLLSMKIQYYHNSNNNNPSYSESPWQMTGPEYSGWGQPG